MAFYNPENFVVGPYTPMRTRKAVYENETLVIKIEMEAGYSAEPHNHTWATLYYFTSGEGRARCGDEWQDVKAGTLVMIPPLAMHAVQTKTAMSMVEVQCNCPESFANWVLGRTSSGAR